MDNKCRFCDCETTVKNGYHVCENCKTVCFTKGFSNQKIYQEIQNYLQAVRQDIRNQTQKLHDLEQKDILGRPLSQEETDVQNCLNQFSNLECELNLIVSKKISLRAERTRKFLYELLKITNILEKIGYKL